YCLVGRWFRHMPGKFMHTNIANSSQKHLECAVGWIAHYIVGVGYALVLVAIVSADWLARPTLLPALLFGIGTLLVPFLVMQPSFGLGTAASRAHSHTQARLKSLMAHIAFGVGLYVCAVVLGYVVPVHASPLATGLLVTGSSPIRCTPQANARRKAGHELKRVFF